MTISRKPIYRKRQHIKYKHIYINRYIYTDSREFHMFTLERQVECMAIFLILVIIFSIFSIGLSLYSIYN